MVDQGQHQVQVPAAALRDQEVQAGKHTLVKAAGGRLERVPALTIVERPCAYDVEACLQVSGAEQPACGTVMPAIMTLNPPARLLDRDPLSLPASMALNLPTCLTLNRPAHVLDPDTPSSHLLDPEPPRPPATCLLTCCAAFRVSLTRDRLDGSTDPNPKPSLPAHLLRCIQGLEYQGPAGRVS